MSNYANDLGISVPIIKSGASFSTQMTQAMETLLGEGDVGYLLYNGEQFPYKEPIKVINYRDYLQSNPPINE